MDLTNTIPFIGVALKQDVLDAINIPQHRIEIARIMKVGEQSIINYLDRNDVKLTQYAVLQYVKKVTECLGFDELLEPRKAISGR